MIKSVTFFGRLRYCRDKTFGEQKSLSQNPFFCLMIEKSSDVAQLAEVWGNDGRFDTATTPPHLSTYLG
jgi:hypothetical protein